MPLQAVQTPLCLRNNDKVDEIDSFCGLLLNIMPESSSGFKSYHRHQKDHSVHTKKRNKKNIDLNKNRGLTEK